MIQVYLLFTLFSLLAASSFCIEQSLGMGIEGSHIVMKTSCSSFFFNSLVNNAQVRILERWLIFVVVPYFAHGFHTCRLVLVLSLQSERLMHCYLNLPLL